MRIRKPIASFLTRLVALMGIGLATMGAGPFPHDRDPWLPELTEGQGDPACDALLNVVRDGYRSPIYILNWDSLPWTSEGPDRIEKLAWTEVQDQRVEDFAFEEYKGKYYTIDLGALGIGRQGLLADFHWTFNWASDGFSGFVLADKAALNDLISKKYPAQRSKETIAILENADRSRIYSGQFRHTPVLRYRDRLFIFEADNNGGIYVRRGDVDTSRFIWRELTPDGKLTKLCQVDARPKLDYWQSLPKTSIFAPPEIHPWDAGGNRKISPYLEAVISTGPLGDFLTALGDIVGDEGDGPRGTLDVWGYRTTYDREAVVEAHMRPWAFTDPKAWYKRLGVGIKKPGFDDHQFSEKLGFLHEWGLQGPWQHKKAAEFEAAFSDAAPKLSSWYETQFGYSKEDAKKTAEAVLQGLTIVFLSGGGSAEGFSEDGFIKAIARNLANPRKDNWDKPYFVGFDGCGNRFLRALILAGAPIADLQALLDTRANLNPPDPRPYCGNLDSLDPLLAYALDRPDVLQYLISKGANVNETTYVGKSALMLAAHMNKPTAARILLEAGAEVNARTAANFDNFVFGFGGYGIKYRGRTALIYAAENAGPEMVSLLLAHGADPTVKDSGGRDVFAYLMRNRIVNDQERDAIRTMLSASAVPAH